MGGLFGKGGGTQQTVSKQEIDPAMKALFMSNYGKASSIADRPYGGPDQQVAAANPTQQLAQNALTQVQTGNVGGATMGNAVNAAQSVAGYNPLQVGTNYNPLMVEGGYQPQQVNAQSLSGTDLSPYMNPYQNDVINATIGDINRARGQAQVGDSQAATMAGAWGGSRHGVADSLTNEAYDRNMINAVSGLNAANFNQAQNAATGDISRGIQTQGMNQSAGLQGAGLNQNAALANQSAGLQGAGLNQAGQIANQNAGLNGAQLGLGAAQVLGGLSGQELNQSIQRAGAAGAAGDQQQAQSQAQMDAQYQNLLNQWMYPMQGQQLRNQALGIMPVGGTTTTTEPRPDNTGDMLGGLGSLLSGGAQIAGMFMGSDKSLKEDITHLYTDGRGVNWYRYRYKGIEKEYVGVMAQELQEIIPGAVMVHPSGSLMVNYSMLS